MREIKFLAYVNNPIHGKGVFPVKSIHFDPFVCEVVMRDEIVNFFDFDDITLLQYTGFQDSDGKEIYADDILEVKDANGVVCRTVVEHIEGAFVIDKWYPKEPTSVEHVNYTGDWEQVEVDIEDYEFLGVVLQHHLEFKVIGNRHEHHHLLGGEEQ